MSEVNREANDNNDAEEGNNGGTRQDRKVHFDDVDDSGVSGSPQRQDKAYSTRRNRKISWAEHHTGRLERVDEENNIGDGNHPLRRSNSLPSLRPGVHRLLLTRAKRSPSANIIKKEGRYASLKKVDKESRRRSHAPLMSSKSHLLDPNLYQALLAHSKRSPSANVIKKEYRYAALKKVDDNAPKRRPEPMIPTGLLLDPDVFELLLARAKRSPSANVIKKEFRYACLRRVNRKEARRPGEYDDDAVSLSSLSTMFSHWNDFDDEDDEDCYERGLYVYDWLIDLEPMMPEPSMFPYYDRATFSEGGRRMSGSTLATNQSDVLRSMSSVVSEGSEAPQTSSMGDE